MPLIRTLRPMVALHHPPEMLRAIVGCVMDYDPERSAAILAANPQQANPGRCFIIVDTPAFLAGLREMNQPAAYAYWEKTLIPRCKLVYFFSSSYEVVVASPQGA